MDYGLVQQLHDAGYPVNTPDVPDLEELIEACGGDIIGIVRTENGWHAKSFKDTEGQLAHNSFALNTGGATPTEAVAKLWLALQKK